MAIQRRLGSAIAESAVPALGGTALAPAVAAAVDPGAGDAALLRAARRRPFRVTCLTVAIILMSLADLYITITYLRTVGMGEGNPIARYVIQHGSQSLLIAWKCASVALASLIFLRYRDRKIVEAATWFAFGVLLLLLIQWIGYANEAWRLTPALHTLPDAESAMWVQMGE